MLDFQICLKWCQQIIPYPNDPLAIALRVDGTETISIPGDCGQTGCAHRSQSATEAAGISPAAQIDTPVHSYIRKALRL
jgi:hypothetical protein